MPVSRRTHHPSLVRIGLTVQERQRFARWWIEQSGLTGAELRAIATGIWADRVLEPVPDPNERRHAA